MESLSENLVRAAMNNVDIWRAIERLENEGWNEQAIADALALPVRTVKRLKLLARLHLPTDAGRSWRRAACRDPRSNCAPLRQPASRSRRRSGRRTSRRKEDEFSWYHVAHALSKRRIPFAAAKFDDDLARAYGVEWHGRRPVRARRRGWPLHHQRRRLLRRAAGMAGQPPPRKGTLLTQNELPGSPSCPRRPSASTASRARATSPATTSIRTLAR